MAGRRSAHASSIDRSPKSSSVDRSAKSSAEHSAGRDRNGKPHERSSPDPHLLDRLIHERLRLGIVSALAVNDRLSFNDLKQLLGTTDGNLSVHARKLEEAGYIGCEKTFDNRVPRTDYRLTAAGRRALEKYLRHMEALITAIRK